MNKPDRKNSHRKLALRSQTIAIIALSRRLGGAGQAHEEEDAASTSACCVTST